MNFDSEILRADSIDTELPDEGSTDKLGLSDLGPVVQSIVSLTRSLRDHLVKCFMTS